MCRFRCILRVWPKPKKSIESNNNDKCSARVPLRKTGFLHLLDSFIIIFFLFDFFSFLFMLIFFLLFAFISLLPLFLMGLSRWYYVTFTSLYSLHALYGHGRYIAFNFNSFGMYRLHMLREWRSIQLKKNDRFGVARRFPIRYDIKTRKRHTCRKCVKATYTPQYNNQENQKNKLKHTWNMENEDDKREIKCVRVKWSDRRAGKVVISLSFGASYSMFYQWFSGLFWFNMVSCCLRFGFQWSICIVNTFSRDKHRALDSKSQTVW